MSEREILCLDGSGLVVDVVVIGQSDPNELIDIYGYATVLDRLSHPEASVGWRFVDGSWRPPQPFASWTWNGNRWIAPNPMPNDGLPYDWDEQSATWIVQADAAKAAAKASAIAKLAALGLTEEEAAALVGQ